MLIAVVLGGLCYRYFHPPEVTFCWPDALEAMDEESTSQICRMIHAAEIASSFKLDLNAYQMAEEGSDEDIAPHFVLLRQYPDLADRMYVPVILVPKRTQTGWQFLFRTRILSTTASNWRRTIPNNTATG